MRTIVGRRGITNAVSVKTVKPTVNCWARIASVYVGAASGLTPMRMLAPRSTPGDPGG